MRWIIFVIMLAVSPVWADGVDGALTDPAVVPILRAPSSDYAPLSASGALAGPNAGGVQDGPVRIGDYPVRIAWDHVAVAAAILGAMYLLGDDAAAGSTN